MLKKHMNNLVTSSLEARFMWHKVVVVIGCGHHYCTQHHDVLENHQVDIELLVDLVSQKERIFLFFKEKKIKPKNFLFLDHGDEPSSIPSDLIGKAEGVIISVEPSIKKAYYLWAARLGLAIFTDKPLTAFSSLQTADLWGDYLEILYAVEQANVPFIVCCERRDHMGYLFLKEHLAKIEHSITSLDLQFSGGIFKTFQEYLSDPCHPFFHGYGILLHSGYHYIDLICSLVDVTGLDFEIKIRRPSNLKEGGEIDFMLIGQSDHLQLSLMLRGTSLSLRDDTNFCSPLKGKVRQEQLTLHLGHFASIHISSYPYQKLKPQNHYPEHFSFIAMHSPLCQGIPSLVQINRVDLSTCYPQLPVDASMNRMARNWQLTQFLEGKEGRTTLKTHSKTIKFLDMIYKKIRQESLCVI